jgi:FkbM family methyltransferase
MQSNSFVTNLFRGINNKLTSIFSNKNKKAELTWIKEKFLKHATPGKVRRFSFKGRNIFFKSPSEFLYTMKEIFVEEIYNIDLPDNSVIIDCGANIGLSVIYLKEKFPAATIIAFEPDDDNYSLLMQNIESFKLQNVDARKEAVWIRDEELSFSNEGTMGSKIELSANSAKKVKAIRLKNLLSQKIHFLKIDIEGAEYNVLKDIADSLKNVDNMFLEYHGKFNQANELTEIFAMIQNAGFAYYIKEAAEIYKSPLLALKNPTDREYDVQLNIFCLRKSLPS